MLKRVLIPLAVLAILSAFSSTGFANCQPLYGPEDLEIGRFRMHISFHKFRLEESGEGLITISKDGLWNSSNKWRTPRGFFLLNGQRISLRKFLRSNETILTRKVKLANRNHLLVFLRGARGASINFTIIPDPPIRLEIVSPVENESTYTPYVRVKGTVANATCNETGVTVNGILAMVDENQFIANHIPLAEGGNTVKVIATDTNGNKAEASVYVTAASADHYIRLEADTYSGVSPLEVILRVSGSFGFPETLSITAAWPGGELVPELLGDNQYRVVLTEDGTYYFTATAKDNEDNVYTDEIYIVVLDRDKLNTLLTAKWDSMKQALAQNDINEAIDYFEKSSRDSYREIFSILEPLFSEITQELGSIRFIKMTDNVVEYDIRTIRNDREYSFLLLFAKDDSGLWKIRSF